MAEFKVTKLDVNGMKSLTLPMHIFLTIMLMYSLLSSIKANVILNVKVI